MQDILTCLVSELQVALLPGYHNFSQSPDQTRQVTKSYLLLSGVTGCPRKVFFVGGHVQPARVLGPRGRLRSRFGVGLRHWARLPQEHLEDLLSMPGGSQWGEECQQDQKSTIIPVGFGPRYSWDYLLMKHRLYPKLVRSGKHRDYSKKCRCFFFFFG